MYRRRVGELCAAQHSLRVDQAVAIDLCGVDGVCVAVQGRVDPVRAVFLFDFRQMSIFLDLKKPKKPYP